MLMGDIKKGILKIICYMEKELNALLINQFIKDNFKQEN